MTEVISRVWAPGLNPISISCSPGDLTREIRPQPRPPGTVGSAVVGVPVGRGVPAAADWFM